MSRVYCVSLLKNVWHLVSDNEYGLWRMVVNLGFYEKISRQMLQDVRNINVIFWGQSPLRRNPLNQLSCSPPPEMQVLGNVQLFR